MLSHPRYYEGDGFFFLCETIPIKQGSRKEGIFMKIITVSPAAAYHVIIGFDNNHMVTLDMREKLQTLRFSNLRNEQTFRDVQTDGKALYWPGGISMSISEILELVAK